VARLEVPVTAKVPVVVALVVVLLIAVRFCIVAKIALKNEVKRLVDEAVVAKKLVAVPLLVKKLVVDALVAAKLFVAVALITVKLLIVPVDTDRLSIVLEAEVRSAILALEIVVVARVEVPVTTNCPVVVELVTVKLVMKDVIALKNDAKRLVDVALVVLELVATKLVAVA
jgi:hypothetical protein